MRKGFLIFFLIVAGYGTYIMGSTCYGIYTEILPEIFAGDYDMSGTELFFTALAVLLPTLFLGLMGYLCVFLTAQIVKKYEKHGPPDEGDRFY